MKRNILTSLVLALITFSLYAQDPNILWQRTIGGNDTDYLYSIDKTDDGGIILGGFSRSGISGDKTEENNGIIDFWIVKLDINQNIEWQNTIGGNGDDRPYSISQTIDGGYIIGGVSTSNSSGDKTEDCLGFSDYWVVKLNSSGSIEWENTIGGGFMGGFETEILESIIQTNDGGYMLAGWSSENISGDKTENSLGLSDYWVVKLNSFGTIEWQNTIGGSSSDYLKDITQTNDGGYILIGESFSDISGDKTEDSSGSDIWVIKLNSTGIIQWQNTIGGNGYDEGFRVKQTTDGGYILGGNSDSDISGDKTENSFGNIDFWVVKIDNSGNLVWQRTVGGIEADLLKTINQTQDGGFIIGGYSDSNISGNKTENSIGGKDYWIIKLNNVGILEWQNTIGGTDRDELYSIFQADDENIVLGGFSKSNFSGDKTEDSHGEEDFWIIKHAQTLGLEENTFTAAISLYPNPTKNTLQLNTQDKTIDQVNIYTITGSKVLQLDIDIVSPTVDVSNLAAGVYYVQLYSGRNVALKKFVKE